MAQIDVYRKRESLSWALSIQPKMTEILVGTILGDPGADKGGKGKSKRAEKYIWNEEK